MAVDGLGKEVGEETLLTGFLEPTSGEVFLKSDNVTRLAQHQRVRRGLARTFQINRLFADLSVLSYNFV